MASSFSLSGNDTIIYGTTVLTDFPNGKIFEATWADTLVEQKVGKNGTVISVFKPLGKKAKATLRLLRASGNDTLVNSDLVNMQVDFPSFKTITLTANKRFGDGNGNIVNDTIVFKGGLVMKNPSISTDVDGDTEQSVISYELTFGSFIRTIS